MIFCILARLPADVLLHNSMRYVCRQWYNIIQDPHFIKEQLLCSTAGLFIRHDSALHTPQFVELGNVNEATVTEIRLPCSKRVLDICRWSLVLYEEEENRTVHVVNPLTKQRVSVSFPSERTRFSLACARSTREYKVVCTYRSDGGKVFDCSIATLGKDGAWKLINSERLSDPHRELLGEWPFSIEGVIYWPHNYYQYVIALVVESEILREIPSPEVISLGTILDVWVLSDPMSGEWRKLHQIDFDTVQRRRLSRLFKGLLTTRRYGGPYFTPVAWVNSGEVVVFSVEAKTGPYIALNVETRETFAF
ncbi:hypothetical protein RHGRI_034379 [Rhododendron griersonianum]|uniref:F-box associated beta-propeller type 3 domain-containing protein n=1 Tax=Rhododendron griersonianum TaxID=479676 RepID=A0AAV6I0H8_9ERIC|nr:hypothetical protein RHGRI_034379 [Rhododendron griersonianum]